MSLKLVTPTFILANSEDPDEMPQSWNATICGISSESSLFAHVHVLVYGFPVYNRLILVKFLYNCFGLVYCFTSQSTAMIMLGWSVHLTTLFSWASLNKRLTSTLCAHTFVTLLKSAEWRRMTVKLFHDQSPWKYGTGWATQPGLYNCSFYNILARSWQPLTGTPNQTSYWQGFSMPERSIFPAINGLFNSLHAEYFCMPSCHLLIFLFKNWLFQKKSGIHTVSNSLDTDQAPPFCRAWSRYKRYEQTITLADKYGKKIWCQRIIAVWP